MIRDQPRKERELARRHAAGAAGEERPTEVRALRALPKWEMREYEAVEEAKAVTRRLPDGELRIRLVELMYWRRSHTMDGAALECHVSYRTARRWHGEFIRMVASCLGLSE